MALRELFASIASAIRAKKGTSALISPTNFAEDILSIPSGGGSDGGGWVRPSDRPTPPTIGENEQVVYQLFGVNDHSPNDNAFRMTTSTGQYQVDWGDGIVENYNSAVTAEHMYDYSTLDKPVGSEGYKWVWIKITPVSGNLTIINYMQYRPALRPSGTTSNIFVPQVFEIYIQSPFVTSIYNSSSYYIRLQQVDIFKYIGTNLITDFSSFCWYFRKLKVLEIDTSKGTNFTRFLEGCSSFNMPLNIDTSNGTIFTYFMYGCYSFNQPLDIDTSNGTDFRNFLQSCLAFNQPLDIDTSNGTIFQTFMDGCGSFNKSLVVNLSNAVTAIGTGFIGMSNVSLKSLRLVGMGAIHTALRISYSILDTDALVLLFGDLYDRSATTAGTITITGVYGASRLTAQQRAIATSKNWTIVE